LLIGDIPTQLRRTTMRLRKEPDAMQEEDILLIAKVSDALAHPARIKIFRFIMNANRDRKKICNKDVVEAFDYSQATISQHIKKLVTSGLLEVQKSDRFSYYYANLGVLMKYLDATKKFPPTV
jgi:DNA-binding transcriptional ArsR family regulator